MPQASELVRDVLAAADGEIVGRIRLQKIFYLLEELGLGGGMRYAYHHYGPYSQELAGAVFQAQVLDKSIVEDTYDYPSGGSLSTYRLAQSEAVAGAQVGSLDREVARRKIAAMKRHSSVEIELAATIHWLRRKENVSDCKAELRRRKPTKATDPAIAGAERLLDEIGLS